MNKIALLTCLLALLVIGCQTGGGDRSEAPPESGPVDEAGETGERDSGKAQAESTPKEGDSTSTDEAADVEVMPLQHASFLLDWDDLVIAVDPVSDALEVAGGEQPEADLVLLTDIHPDHLDPRAVDVLRGEDAPIVAPQSVVEEAGDALPDEPVVMANGDTRTLLNESITIEATPMYNIERTNPDTGEPFHVKGRGNGYLLERDDTRVYISGDTECTPEMRALEDIDIALVTMNVPYTMPVEEAAECIREFQPSVVYPFHYRGQDPAELEELLADVAEVEIRLLDWYPGEE